MWVVRRYLSSVVKRRQFGLLCHPRFGSLPELQLQYLQCTCCWRSQVTLTSFDTLISAVTSSSLSQPRKGDSSGPLDTLYTLEQRNAILELLNTASASELAGMKILGGRKLLNIVEYRSKHGPFTTLESVTNVPLLKHKSAVMIFNSIINPERVQMSKFILPEVDTTLLKSASSILSIICGIRRIAWAHVDRRMTVLDWQEKKCPNFMEGTYMASSYLKDVSSVVSCLPSADFYVIEKPSMSVQNSLQNTALFPLGHLRVVEAMLFALLESTVCPTKTNIPPRVLNISRTTVGRHFKLMVGDSRVCGAQTVRELMTESVTQELPRINIPRELIMKYMNHFNMDSRNDGEELSDSLLQAVAFYELLRDSSAPVSCPQD